MSIEKFKKRVWISFMILLIVSLFSVESFVSNAIADDGNSECSLEVFKGYWECLFNGFIPVDGFVPIIAIGEFRSDGEGNFYGVGPRTVLLGDGALSEVINCKLKIISEENDPVCVGEAVCEIGDPDDPDRIESFNFALINPNKTIFSSGVGAIVSGTCERISKEDDDDDGDDDDDD